MSTQNTYRNIINSAYKETGLQGVTTDKTHKNEKEIVYRKNGKSIDKVIEFDSDTGCKIRTTHYDYFNDNKIRSIDEYDKETGKKLRTINYVLYKSIDEYDFETGEKYETREPYDISCFQDLCKNLFGVVCKIRGNYGYKFSFHNFCCGILVNDSRTAQNCIFYMLGIVNISFSIGIDNICSN